MNSIIKSIAVFLVMLPFTQIAQSDTAAWGDDFEYNRKYDPKSVTTVSGSIVSVNKITHKKGQSAGIHLELKTSGPDQTVHVGPEWYLDKQNIRLKAGDKIIVHGSKVTIDSKQIIIAKDVIKDGNTLILRDKNGKPLWSGKGNR